MENLCQKQGGKTESFDSLPCFKHRCVIIPFQVATLKFFDRWCKPLHIFLNSGGHLGQDKTLHKICSRFYWKPDMTSDVKKFIETCDICQRVNDKFTKPSVELHPIPVESEIWQQVCLAVLTVCMVRVSLIH